MAELQPINNYMVKPKQRNNRSAPGKKHQNPGSPKPDQPEEEDWVLIKKQRITIIIPPLPNKMHSTMPSVGDDQPEKNPTNTNNTQSPQKPSSQPQSPLVISAPVQEPDKSTPSPEPPNQPPTIAYSSEHDSDFHKPSSSSLHGIGICSTSRGSRGMKMFADSSVFLNRRMRASYLETKLKKAGGLEKWLVSLGLARFVEVFQMKRVNKFQLANLTMQKLKEMGTDAVGPRRKLIHAIDCFCEPHCFQHA